MDGRRLAAGAGRGHLSVTSDGGETWTEVGTHLPRNPLLRLALSSHDLERIHACLYGAGEGDVRPYLYVSEDFGATWSWIGEGLPHAGINVAMEDPDRDGTLYAGTDLGATDPGPIRVLPMRFLSLAVMLMSFLACDASRTPAPPPVGQWRVAWLSAGGTGSEIHRPGTSWRMRIDHQGPERTLEVVCETYRAGELDTAEVLLSTPLLETVRVDKGDYITIEDVDAEDSAHVNLEVTLIDLSRHLDGTENAYLQVQRWGRSYEGHTKSPDAIVSVPALSAPGNQGGGPSWSLGDGSVWDVDEKVILTTFSRWNRDEGQGSGVESQIVLRLR